MPGLDAEPKSVVIWASLLEIHCDDDDDDHDQETFVELHNITVPQPSEIKSPEGSLTNVIKIKRNGQEQEQYGTNLEWHVAFVWTDAALACWTEDSGMLVF